MILNVFTIKLIMAEREMSNKDLANKMGSDNNNLYRVLKNGRCNPKTAGKIAHALGVHVEDIVVQE